MEVFHQGEFGLGAGFPAEIERGHEVAELLAIEDHAVEDAVHEALKGGGGEAVLRGDVGKFLGALLGLEAGIAVADGGLRQALPRLERGDVFGDVVALMNLASALMRPMSSSRVILALPGPLAENLAMRPMM